ncbi:MAG TPA: pyrrolo-quinoline quinone, partial [Anaeromyxobacter sp.]|nr:pyrrolo-quinoline quinone [Anaeromyxobacter sp.]
DGTLGSTSEGGVFAPVAKLSESVSDGAVVVSVGDIVIGDVTGSLHRLSPSGTPLWTPEPQLGSAVLSPLVIAGSTQAFIVPTKAGSVFALTDAGAEVWHATLGSGAELRTGNLFTPPGQAAGQLLSEAIFSSADGKLYDVIVDGQLDPAAPWPKAFHDRRNTSNAGTRP